ncbi:hypothetical protein NCCP2716_14500 [Sporosarcina sp. NCCP-2716]|uniref:BclA C-terminal domain-containing protein n=1 Tax=Sporosarcina sp. NCCP-2716 TaxID=2943679 RepID=UPI00204174E4|nr:collagen-like protein [Sporosarcina sp. NCCP-2716]GKV68952.1 hypothetical protein NCCP2716_14500 [Sporosarcina sp. NCCP-2716]
MNSKKRRCNDCKKHECSCKVVCKVPSVSIGPIKASAPDESSVLCGLCEYAYVYNLTPQTVAIGADVIFDSNGIMTPGITHIPGTSQITVLISGDYEVTFSVSGTEPNQFTLFKNGLPVAGTTYGSGAGTQQNNGQAIISVIANDILTLRNYSSAAAVGLASVIGGTQANVNASILIKMLSTNTI